MNTQKSYWPLFFIVNIIAACILISWHMAFTRHYWNLVDTQIFYYLNGWVGTNHFAQVFWAITNYRPFDLIPFIIMLASICVGGFFIPTKDIKRVAVLFFVAMIYLLGLRFLMHGIYDLQRHSPSLVLLPANLLSTLVPFIHSKDASIQSFPGDHAAVIFVWVGFMLAFAKRPYQLIAILLGIFFTLPRLIAGAHWFTDDFVGGSFIALMTLSWVLLTPIAKYAILYLTPFLDWCLKLMPEFVIKLTFEKR